MLKSSIKFILPLFLVEHYRRVKWLQSQGFPWDIRKGFKQTLQMVNAIEQCNYPIWPMVLKTPPYEWTLVDVGASEGDFSEAVLSVLSPKEVFVIEPLPSCYPYLAKKFSANKNCRIIQKAVGRNTGSIELHCTQNTKFTSVLEPLQSLNAFYPSQDIDVTRKIKVPMVQLDEILIQVEKIGLLKIDVQGYELEVLRGATQVLERTIALMLEINYLPHYKGATEFDPVYRFLADRGFTLAGVSQPFGSKIPLWADAIFTRQST